MDSLIDLVNSIEISNNESEKKVKCDIFGEKTEETMELYIHLIESDKYHYRLFSTEISSHDIRSNWIKSSQMLSNFIVILDKWITPSNFDNNISRVKFMWGLRILNVLLASNSKLKLDKSLHINPGYTLDNCPKYLKEILQKCQKWAKYLTRLISDASKDVVIPAPENSCAVLMLILSILSEFYPVLNTQELPIYFKKWIHFNLGRVMEEKQARSKNKYVRLLKIACLAFQNHIFPHVSRITNSIWKRINEESQCYENVSLDIDLLIHLQYALTKGNSSSEFVYQQLLICIKSVHVCLDVLFRSLDHGMGLSSYHHLNLFHDSENVFSIFFENRLYSNIQVICYYHLEIYLNIIANFLYRSTNGILRLPIKEIRIMITRINNMSKNQIKREGFENDEYDYASKLCKYEIFNPICCFLTKVGDQNPQIIELLSNEVADTLINVFQNFENPTKWSFDLIQSCWSHLVCDSDRMIDLELKVLPTIQRLIYFRELSDISVLRTILEAYSRIILHQGAGTALTLIGAESLALSHKTILIEIINSMNELDQYPIISVSICRAQLLVIETALVALPDMVNSPNNWLSAILSGLKKCQKNVPELAFDCLKCIALCERLILPQVPPSISSFQKETILDASAPKRTSEEVKSKTIADVDMEMNTEDLMFGTEHKTTVEDQGTEIKGRLNDVILKAGSNFQDNDEFDGSMNENNPDDDLDSFEIVDEGPDE